MAILSWRGDAQGRQQITKLTPANVEVGDVFTVTINRKDISVTATEATVDNACRLLKAAIDAAIENGSPAEFTDITLTSGDTETQPDGSLLYTNVVLYGKEDGTPFTISTSTTEGGIGITIEETRKGDAGRNEIQRITLSGSPTGGTFTLTFDGQTTGTIAYNASAGTVQTALEALSNIASGDVTVTGSAGGPWNVEFKQVYAKTDVSQMTGNGASLTYGAGSKSVNISTTQDGGGRINQVQLIDMQTPTDTMTGTFTITFDGETTSSLTAGDSAATVQTALEALSNLASGDVVVRTAGQSAASNPPAGLPPMTGVGYSVEFKGAYAGVNAPLLSVDGTSLDGVARTQVSTIQDGASYTACKLQIRVTGGWSLTLTHPTTGLLTASATMNPLASAATVKATLGAMTGYSPSDFDVVRTGNGVTYNSEYIVSFVGSLGGKNFDVWTSGSTSLPGLIFVGSNQTLEIIQDGSATAINEKQYLFWSGGRKATGGTFTLTLDGQTTAGIAYDATAAAIELELEGLSNIGSGNVDVTGSDGGPWTIEFKGTLAGTPLNSLSSDNTNLTGHIVPVTIFRAADPGTNEVQQVALGGGPSGGTFTLTWSGQTTAGIAYNATAAAVQSALEGLSNIAVGEVSVSGEDGGPWLVTFQGTLGGTNQVAMTGDASSLTGGTVDIGTIQTAQSLVNEQQTVTINQATGGTFTLTYSSQTTAAIAFSASAATVQTSFERLSSVGAGNALVSGSAGGPYLIEFTGTLGGTDISAITADASSLTGAGSQTLTATTTQTPTGPNWWNEPENWSTGSNPANGDTIILENSDVSVLYGIDQLSSITPALLRIKASFEGSIGPSLYNEAGYIEYRPTHLICKADKVVIGEGEGSGSARIHLDTNTRSTEVVVMATGQNDDPALPAVLWKGTNSGSTIRIFKGSVGLAILAGETAEIATLQIGYREDPETDAEVATGVGLTVAAVQKSGGDLRMMTASGSTMTVTQTAGYCAIDGEGAVSQLTIRGGEVKYNTTGTLGGNTVVAGEGWLDFAQDMRTKTVTNAIEKYDDTSRITDPFQTVNPAGSFVIDCNQSAMTGIDIGRNRRASFAAVA